MGYFRELPSPTRWAAYVLLGLLGFMIFDQYHWWQLQEEYAFGFIVPFFVGYLLYDRWPVMAGFLVRPEAVQSVPEKSPMREEWERTPWWSHLPGQDFWRKVFLVIAYCMLIGGLLAFALGGLNRALEGNNLISSNLIAFGFANILLGTVYIYADRRADGESIPFNRRLQVTLLFLFPALIWMLSVPMFSAVHSSISLFLMNKVAVVVYHSFDILGYAIVREGSVLRLPEGDVGVEDACSGIRSLTACLFAGSFLGAAYFQQFWKKLFLVGTAMLFAFINNILRSLFLTAWAYAKGPTGLDMHVKVFGMDLGNVHDFTGWVVLGFTVICLLVLVKLFSFEWEVPASGNGHVQPAGSNAT